METLPGKQVVAVIDIGTSAIRLVVAEVGAKDEVRHLENLQKPVRFGRDVFTTGHISTPVMREALEILKNYKTVIDGYGAKKVQAIATSAVREASNRDTFIDQVFVRTGLDIEILEGPEENRLELIAVEHALEGKMNLEAKNCLILEVGSGSTELILLNQGRVEITRTLSFGSVRLPGQRVPGETASSGIQRALKRDIHEIAQYAAREYSIEQVNTFIALGGDVRFVAAQFHESITGRFVELDKKAFLNFTARVAKMTPEEITAQYGLSYGQAETLYPALLIYSCFFNETHAEVFLVPMVSIRDALLLEMAQFLSGYKRTDLSKQVLNSARHLAEKYKYDKLHAAQVASTASKLFDVLEKEHGMGTRERLLLEVSGILHDIGTFISPAGHHKHSSYLVTASEIFGLRKSDKNIVSNVVRYHRRVPPHESHEAYMSLPKADRAVVSKLAAILRVADSLDHAHQQKIRQWTVERSEDALTLWIPGEVGDVSLERDALGKKGDLFTAVFGMTVQLKQRPLETSR
ncbi:MAG: HD domain-containing protein [Candidatus Omnitrophota bacterium]|jgi:exopolyphosphatase/guanosine-5'-triphosphate,3'-diphosphate pyrophosphatase